jgi:hypothetical protein
MVPVTQYLLSIYQPDGEPPADLDLDKMTRELGELRAQIQEAGQWVFAGGLLPADSATVVRSTGGEVLTTDGPYTEGKEHLGGFTLVRSPDLDAALVWARRTAEITGLPVEVRPLYDDAPNCDG